LRTVLAAILKETVLGGHLLALGTASIAASATALIHSAPSIDLLLMAYLFTYGAYTINRSVEMGRDAVTNPSRTQHLWGRRRYLPAIAVTCFAIGYLLAALRNLTFFTALLVPLFLSIIYSAGSKKLIPWLGVKALKEKLLVKNITIALGWSLIPMLVGLYYQQISQELYLFAGFIFLRLMVNTIFFDIRDLKGDKAAGIKTVPTVYGLKISFTLITLIDIVSAAYIISTVILNLLPTYTVLAVVFPIYSTIYLQLAKRANANINLLCDVVADGEYLLWGPMIFLGRIL
jgi:4-hydroxybenzoate polyprenyltransferase